MKSDESEKDQDAAAERTGEKRAKKLFLRRVVVLAADHEHAHHRKDSADTGDNHRRRNLLQYICTAKRCAKRRRGEDGAAIRFVEVGSHAGNVTDIVAHIVRNGRRVARIVFRDASLDLADEVGSNVRRLRVDTAADTGEKSLHGSPHAECEHRCRYVRHLRREGAARLDKLKTENRKARSHVGVSVD